MQTAVRTLGLCKSYRGKAAVDHLDMQVPQGEIYGFIGANGAGKSTTFKLLAGLAKPTAGQIEIFGQPSKQGTFSRRVGILIEDAGLYGSLSARDNCLLKAKLLGLDDEKSAVDRVLAQVGLEKMGKKAAKRFSMGQRRRLGLALALLGDPDLLLLDEPSNGLDPEGIRDVRLLLQQLQAERGVTVLVSSHILGELEKFATCYGIIRDGHMVEQITAEALSAQCRDYIALQTRTLTVRRLCWKKNCTCTTIPCARKGSCASMTPPTPPGSTPPCWKAARRCSPSVSTDRNWKITFCR